MIARTSLPGCRLFSWRRFIGPRSREMADQWVEHHHDRHGQLGAVLTERQAASVRWNDGRPVYPRDATWGVGRAVYGGER